MISLATMPASWLLFLPIFLAFITYAVYYLWLHPLAHFPGPSIPALTNLWTFSATLNDHHPRSLLTYHSRYNSHAIRVGPNSLHFNTPEAFLKIYKSGWSKSSFYDGFGAPGPRGLFNETDEAAHAIKHKMFAHAFSITSLQEMEAIMDARYGILRTQLDRLAVTNAVFDLKHYISFCLSDILGELAFGRAWGVQEAEDIAKLPPVEEFLYAGGVKGSWPAPWLLGLVPYIPSEYVSNLLRSIAKIHRAAVEAVEYRAARKEHRLDMLWKIMNTQGIASTTQDDAVVLNLAVELIIGGGNSTANAVSTLLANLIRQPDLLARAIQEVDGKLPPLAPKMAAFPHRSLEGKLEFIELAMRESYRKDPGATFDMPRIVPAGGEEIAGHMVPGGTVVSANLYSLGRNKAVWGADATIFNPDRWYEARTQGLESIVAPFSIGARSCVGENFANMNVLKMVSTLLRSYQFDFLNADEPMVTRYHGGDMMTTPIMVRIKKRGDSFRDHA